MRLDVYLQTYYPDISRAQLQRLIKDGKVKVNGLTQTKNGAKLGEDDAVTVDLKTELAAAELDLKVLFEDETCVVLDKPEGILTHSKGAFNSEQTVASWLSQRPEFNFKTDTDNQRAGIVHRLDRATSGVMICAKTEAALKHLQKQFQDRKAKKTYVARVDGKIKPATAIIDIPIERNPKQPQRFRPGSNGKPAQTMYQTLSVIGKDSLLKLIPATGRTHQLRVHLNYIKHPIIGDTFYGGRKAERLFLHAHKLEITLPNKDRQTFTVEIPGIFKEEII